MDNFYCKGCLTPRSRPRVVFDKNGFCNACNWAETKKSINWKYKRNDLARICDKFRRSDYYDCIVPVSGGKDSSYVAWKMKHELGMNPLCVTFTPPIQTEIGRQNLENFRNSGFDVMEIRPNPEVYRGLCKRMFIEQARSKFPFVIMIGTGVAKLALKLDIPFIIYGEEGETEYSGDSSYLDTVWMPWEYAFNCYHEGNDLHKYLDEFTQKELYWWLPPSEKDFEKLSITWWSKFENWDDELHRDLAVEKCGLLTSGKQAGTFTSHSQVDDYLQDLHAYEMFIKFGFGRATGDCNLAIHAGRMTREEAVEIVKKEDGVFPLNYLGIYSRFFDMSEGEFWSVLSKHVNRDILQSGKGDYGQREKPWILKNPVK